ncbi:hypothetical protein OG948_49080 (plasmid) [Embleya sp. NBC_00888]|uniref:hypothetical protein n=1 Tax=Embleya sp. NBC_00888 TaxID=2975960 RepID=UPI003866DFF5|nr:hypothetical protein OG948_49080 [Embleya sp. NBC_00888]
MIRTAVVSAVVALAVAGLAACDGGSEKSNADKDAKALADDALARLRKADDVKMVGGGDNRGKKQDVDVCLRNADLQGTMKVDGSPVDIVLVGTFVYMKAEPDFWAKALAEQGPQAVLMSKLFAGRYVKTPAEGEDGRDGSVGGMSDFFQGSAEGVVKGEVVTVDGRKLVPLSKKNAKGNTVTLHVPEKGEPFPTLVTVSGSVTMKLNLTRGAQKCAPTAPPADQVIDPDALERGGAPAAPTANTQA